MLAASGGIASGYAKSRKNKATAREGKQHIWFCSRVDAIEQSNKTGQNVPVYECLEDYIKGKTSARIYVCNHQQSYFEQS